MPRTVVGLDIGSSAVRAVELKDSRRGPVLRRFAAVPLPVGAVRAGTVVDADAVAQALRDLWSQGRFSTKNVTLGIANEGVLVRQMDLDWMPPADFRKALRYQVADALPVPVDEANLDYHWLEDLDLPTGQEGQTRRVSRVLLVAAARDVVDGFVRAAHSAGLRVVRADLLPFSLIRFAHQQTGTEPAPEAIVDIGAETVTVVVHQAGRPRFVRMIAGLGGEAVTRALQERYDWSWQDADRTKRVVGLPPASQTPDAAGEPPLRHPAQQVVAEQVAGLVAEIRATLNFFGESGQDEASLSRVLLTGGGARLARLPQLFSDQLSVPVEVVGVRSALRGSRVAKLDERHEACLAVAAGLCMGEVA